MQWREIAQLYLQGEEIEKIDEELLLNDNLEGTTPSQPVGEIKGKVEIKINRPRTPDPEECCGTG